LHNERYKCIGRSGLPEFAERIISELTQPQVDWRTQLIDFVQEEVHDYSFSPPDRRFQDAHYFLPDFNDKEDVIRNILFMIDTSGSMSTEEISAAYSEIRGAIDQFGGKLAGLLGFFDAAVTEPVPFESANELVEIKPVGGGGTSFNVVFDFVREEMADASPASIIIMTDGGADFPPESAANDIPVLWLMTYDKITPPWGRVVRIKV